MLGCPKIRCGHAGGSSRFAHVGGASASRHFFSAACVAYFSLGHTILGAEENRHAIVIRLDASERVVVEQVVLPPTREVTNQHGILVWAEGVRDRWQVLPTSNLQTASSETVADDLIQWGNRGNGRATPPVTVPPTIELTQLVGQVVLRGRGLLTPAENSLVLDGRINFRRRAQANASEPFPADELRVLSDDRIVLRLGVDQGEHTTAWNEIADLPEQLQDGLPPGSYRVLAVGGGESTVFQIAAPAVRERISRKTRPLRELVGENDPLYVQVAMETLFTHRDDQGRPQPLLVDAFELLETEARGPKTTSYLRSLHGEVKSRLEGKAVPSSRQRKATGIDAIDAARDAIATGQWETAVRHLQSAEALSSPRAKALAGLYQAVVLSESGAVSGDAVRLLFAEALKRTREGEPSDQLRAHNNFAAFLVGQSQDRIYNFAFQTVNGVERPLLQSLHDWHDAEQHLRAALAIAETIDPSEAAAIRINLARLYCTLADLLRLVGATSGPEAALLRSAEVFAKETAHAAIDSRTDPAVAAVAHELLAHLSFRNEQRDIAINHADQALTQYLQVGSLAGCEGIYRLKGLLRSEGRPGEADVQLALTDLLISQALADFLRAEFPADRAGLGRAGFLAKRAYVNESIVDLLVQLGRDKTALRFAELSKARSLQDVLRLGQPSVAGINDATVDFDAAWPKDIAALEYLVGTEKTWVFVVDTTGNVRAFQIRDENGEPVRSRDLIARVQRLINSLDRLGPVEGRRLVQVAGSGRAPRYDQSWQRELYWFYQALVPEECRESLRSAETLVIVPHHILHYFPFAAMVTRCDDSAEPTRMPLPRFFVEQEFSLVHAPSLTTWLLLRQRTNRPLEQINVVGIVDFGGRASRLDGVRAEIENLRKIFPDHIGEVLSDADATEARVKALLAKPGALSISTHGQKEPDRPLEAYLVCQPGDKDDGYLRAGEIYALAVYSDLILLNACYGGFADRSPIACDELFGVQRALLYSGARTVVSGLWDIYDGTAPDLMKDFWGHLRAGKSAPFALAEAQRSYLLNWRNSSHEPLRFLTHPYYWAVFTVAGDDRTGSHDAGG